ncbi:hypothetical protein Cni_G13341 [Canna indica]|uniref:O-fucosyltransferase family protein n=1 Tax=Canna indica TaxID=4628 RepID=A0AAQ3QBF1_9LILI|nr:hypothetical protein Cni_G13341 [Canna indica]
MRFSYFSESPSYLAKRLEIWAQFFAIANRVQQFESDRSIAYMRGAELSKLELTRIVASGELPDYCPCVGLFMHYNSYGLLHTFVCFASSTWLPLMGESCFEASRDERRHRPSSPLRKISSRTGLLRHSLLLKALDAPSDARIYWAGCEPFGGQKALLPLRRAFPDLYNMETIPLPSEPEPITNKSSLLATVDYIICEQSDVFMASHGGNMARLLRGHRAFAGHRMFIMPNKRQMIPYFLDTSLPASKFNRVVKELHQGSQGQPEVRIDKVDKDVTTYLVPEYMCNGTSLRSE